MCHLRKTYILSLFSFKMHPSAQDVSAPIDKSEILDLLSSYIQSCLNWLVGPWSLIRNCMSSSFWRNIHHYINWLPIDWMKSSSTPFWSSEVYPHNKLSGWRGWYFTKLRIHEIWSTRGWNFEKKWNEQGDDISPTNNLFSSSSWHFTNTRDHPHLTIGRPQCCWPNIGPVQLMSSRGNQSRMRIIHTFITVLNIVLLIQEGLLVIMFQKISWLSRLFPCKTKGLKQKGDIESTVVPDFVAWFLPRVEFMTWASWKILTPKILHFRHRTEGQDFIVLQRCFRIQSDNKKFRDNGSTITILFRVIPPGKLTCPWKSMVGRCISYWNSPFSGDMLVFGAYYLALELTPKQLDWPNGHTVDDKPSSQAIDMWTCFFHPWYCWWFRTPATSGGNGSLTPSFTRFLYTSQVLHPNFWTIINSFCF